MPADGTSKAALRAGKTYYLPKGLHLRVKAAWWATREHPTLSDLVAAVFDAESGRRERAFNDGKPFPSGTASTGARARGVDGESHTYYMPVAVHERFVAAWAGTRSTATAATSVSALASETLEAEARRLEHTYNDGSPFPPAPARARGVNPTAAQRQGERMSELWQRRRSEK